MRPIDRALVVLVYAVAVFTIGCTIALVLR